VGHVSHKLNGSIEGALAGGGDPATSPLYVFGPFLRLLAVGGVASICFGAAVWLAVLTVVVVSAMYRLVMIWVTDGSGGSGLNEEEFGGWAVKINAGITVIEYTLTFLVSIAALVTFVADRFPSLNAEIMGLSLRTYAAVGFSLVVGFAVNMGPRVAARTFGPATAAVLALLWAMILATIWKTGFHLPSMHWEAFSPEYLHFTLGGYARILALMTGIEIFANLVAAYDGPSRVRSRKAFGSLLIIMGTTSLTMLIVGPAIMQFADPSDPHVSVFTQTMDHLLPAPLPYVGTLIGIAVLLSAAAAASQGLQNLALGLRYRHYIPAWFALPNHFEVADRPVWLQIVVCSICFLAFGTHEETYLALYAAGVFILLSLTGWAAVKRLQRMVREEFMLTTFLSLVGTILAAVLTTVATAIIFQERFFEGAWSYFLLVPALYIIFGYFRRNLGSPNEIEDRLGMVISASTLSQETNERIYAGVTFENILVPLDMSPTAEVALAGAQTIARNYNGQIQILTVVQDQKDQESTDAIRASAEMYLEDVEADLSTGGYRAVTKIVDGAPAEAIGAESKKGDIDLMILTTHGRSLVSRMVVSNITQEVIFQTTPPLIVLRPTIEWRSTRTRFQKLLVTLDGSEIAEQVLPYVHSLASKFDSQVILLSTAEGSESDDYAGKLQAYLDKIAGELSEKGVSVTTQIASTAPATTILTVASEENIDLIMMVSHGRGGLKRQEHVKIGSVVDAVLQEMPCPLFLISAQTAEEAANALVNKAA
jgi:nucleotide-binding universal stress UspA family protein